jgi:flagellar assembly protein FliH
MMRLCRVIPSYQTEESTIPFTPPIISDEVKVETSADILESFDSAFVLDKTQEQVAGIDKIYKNRIDTIVQKAVLERLKQVQEEAYKKGFDLGRQEGRVEAIREASTQIESDIRSFGELILNLQSQYQQLAKLNEGRLVELVFKIASRLAAKTLEYDTQAITEVVRQAVESVSSQDKVTIQIHPSLIQFFEELKTHSGREYDFLKSVDMEPNESISIGGCVVRTQFGEIDAQFETRMENLWQSLKHVIPQVS